MERTSQPGPGLGTAEGLAAARIGEDLTTPIGSLVSRPPVAVSPEASVAEAARAMRDAGASEVHFRVASPPTGHGCYYGVDTPERSKLLAGRMDVDAMREFIHADSLAFVSIDGLYRAVDLPGRNNACPQYCDACFTGDYPTRLTDLAERHLADAQLQFPVDKVA